VISPVAYAFHGLFMSGNSTFNAIGMPSRAAALSLLRAPVLAVSLTWLGAEWLGPRGVFLGHASANLLVGALSGAWLWATLRQARRVEETAVAVAAE
jgi:Na+-driven multidrug efflux pump